MSNTTTNPHDDPRWDTWVAQGLTEDEMRQQMAGYPYKAGDRVMIGISTWQHPDYPHASRDRSHLTTDTERWADIERYADIERQMGPVLGPDGPFCRYFKAATVIANDRKAGILVTESDEPHAGGHGYDEFHFDEWNGEEIVTYDESLPTTPADAQRRALKGESY